MFLVFLFVTISFLLLVLRFLYKTSIIHIFVKGLRSLGDKFHAYQSYKIPQHNEHYQENQLYHKISIYLNSLLATIDDDSDFTNLFSGSSKSNDISLHFDDNQTVHDTFFSARVSWTNEESEKEGCTSRSFVLRIRKNDKRRVLRQYLQHILSVADEVEQKKKEIKLYMNLEQGNRRWRSIPFTHPATFDTVVMDSDLKNKVKSDLEQFLKSKQYYHRLGRVWKRSYLLCGPAGTGKTSFVAAMARFLCYDVYDIDVSKVLDDSDLKTLLLQTTCKSLIVIEDFDKFFVGKSSTAVSLFGMLNFMDGIVSCCGEERVMVFTMMNGKDEVDQAAMRPGRIDVHVQFPLCDFSGFKNMASSYLGVKDHKLFPQLEEVFQSGASLSHAEIGEIMISNRNSPSRALKSIITALQSNINGGQRLSESGSGRSRSDEASEPAAASVFCRESVHTVREFRKLYGLLKMGSRRKESLDLSSAEKEGSQHEVQN